MAWVNVRARRCAVLTLGTVLPDPRLRVPVGLHVHVEHRGLERARMRKQKVAKIAKASSLPCLAVGLGLWLTLRAPPPCCGTP
eukprot:663859-Rhodomonas_salina.1